MIRHALQLRFVIMFIVSLEFSTDALLGQNAGGARSGMWRCAAADVAWNAIPFRGGYLFMYDTTWRETL